VLVAKLIAWLSLNPLVVSVVIVVVVVVVVVIATTIMLSTLPPLVRRTISGAPLLLKVSIINGINRISSL